MASVDRELDININTCQQLNILSHKQTTDTKLCKNAYLFLMQ